MRKPLFWTALLLAALLTSGCGMQFEMTGSDAGVDNSAATALTETDPPTDPQTDALTEEPASETAAPEETDAETEVSETAASEPEAVSADLTGLAGYWFIDGDPSAASIHISEDGSFTTYYATGNEEQHGSLVKEFDAALNNTIYVLYLENGERYLTFADDGEADKYDIYLSDAASTHYVKLFGEGGLGDDGRGDDEDEFAGTWVFERATLTIAGHGEGVYHAQIRWSDSASAFVEWDYPLIFDGEKLVCEHTGRKSYVEYPDGAEVPSITVEYDGGSAEFVLTDGGMRWLDKDENRGEGLLFQRTDMP